MEKNNINLAPIHIVAENGGIVNVNFNFNGAATAAPLIEKFTQKKISAETIQSMLFDLYHQTQPQKAANIANCGNFLTFRKYHNPEQTQKLKSANFCKHPLCPMCAWRYSVAWAQKLLPGVLRLKEQGKFLYHCVLTMPNVESMSKTTLSDLRKAKNKFFRSVLKPFAYADSLEITISKSGQFHPHIHAILAMDTEFDCSKSGIETMRKQWNLYMPSKFDYTICAMYPIRNTQHDVSEICKYIFTSKAGRISHSRLNTIAESVHGVRKVNLSGEMAKAVKEAGKIAQSDYIKLIADLEQYGYTDLFYQWNRKQKQYNPRF